MTDMELVLKLQALNIMRSYPTYDKKRESNLVEEVKIATASFTEDHWDEILTLIDRYENQS